MGSQAGDPVIPAGTADFLAGKGLAVTSGSAKTESNAKHSKPKPTGEWSLAIKKAAERHKHRHA